MDDVGEVLTQNIPVQMASFEPETVEMDFNDFIGTEPAERGESGVFDTTFEEDIVEAGGLVESDSRDSNEVENTKLEPRENEKIDEEERLITVRQELNAEKLRNDLENRDSGLTSEETALIGLLILYLLREAEKKKKKQEKGIIELLVQAIAWLMQEMFVSEDPKKEKQEKKNNQPLIEVNLDGIDKIYEVFKRKQEAMHAPVENEYFPRYT